LGLQAAASGYKAAISSGKREFVATSGGVNFQIYLDTKTGVVLNFFPVN
jgi:filamentous hemagglutinin